MAYILVVDDEDAIVELLSLTLQQAGYRCDTAMDGNTAATLIDKNEYDLILLDIMLPEIDGYDLMQYLAPTGTPVIFLTAKSTVADRIKGLRMGADDYITKPFDAQELLARIESVLRRTGRGANSLTAFSVSLNLDAKTVTQNGKVVLLTPRELALLEVLMRNQGIALYRDTLFEKAWGEEPNDDTRTLDVNIMRLRKKLNWFSQIRTVHKVGYLLEKEP
ncbi:response regulator transcription factor [Ruminococcaceae bacterium OttesenSCG-928-A16]|nr:response regulator transcription factor [Ruminococcaceae bacterium OttesenSCG-928-A16]